MRKEEGVEKKRGGCRNTKGLEKRRKKKEGVRHFFHEGKYFLPFWDAHGSHTTD